MMAHDPRHTIDRLKLGVGSALSHHHNDLRPSIICVGRLLAVVELASYSVISLTTGVLAPDCYLAMGTLERCHGKRRRLHGHTHAGRK